MQWIHPKGWARLAMIAACFLAGSSVALGAFAAHGLAHQLSASYLAVFKTGVQYQMWHALALMGCALWLQHSGSRWLRAGVLCLLLGTVLFSGSLYALTLLGMPKLGMITPIGGVTFLLGWSCLMIAAWRYR
ncbi:hypothetical protein VST7929_02172 [Vibrio stylophorae]|uniref:DUF423 domain-containing protein n=1 Tax=Vibrio stylophorae TaxID=659351 RepID=A0ABN8DU10_9VIBR|nr:DUF423 domain-containing protein [Vibrio stylophorae]CAH0534257.1 hypothetical protein VST7929_02172 [Vibrio stylophorae]